MIIGQTVTVYITSTYECGRESKKFELVRGPVPGEPLDEWWEGIVYPLTGDGHPCALSEDAHYEATVIHANDPELLPGATMTWGG